MSNEQQLTQPPARRAALDAMLSHAHTDSTVPLTCSVLLSLFWLSFHLSFRVQQVQDIIMSAFDAASFSAAVARTVQVIQTLLESTRAPPQLPSEVKVRRSGKYELECT